MGNKGRKSHKIDGAPEDENAVAHFLHCRKKFFAFFRRQIKGSTTHLSRLSIAKSFNSHDFAPFDNFVETYDRSKWLNSFDILTPNFLKRANELDLWVLRRRSKTELAPLCSVKHREKSPVKIFELNCAVDHFSVKDDRPALLATPVKAAKETFKRNPPFRLRQIEFSTLTCSHKAAAAG